MDPFAPPHRLAFTAAKQWNVFTRAQAEAAGVDGRELDRRRRAGQLYVLRRGVYVCHDRLVSEDQDRSTHHLMAATARCLVTKGDTVVSHESAAAVLRYRLLDDLPVQPTLTVARPEGARALRVHDLYSAAVPAQDRLPMGPVVDLTSPARTVADCCRNLRRDAALVIADSALANRVRRGDVLAVLDRCARWPGAAVARQVVLFADARSESALESLARQWFLEQGLPAPKLQVRLASTTTGLFLGRVDFLWPDLRTVCEMDGRIKYEDPKKDDAGGFQRRRPRTSNPLFEEKKREDALRDSGLEVVRGYWSDGEDRGARLAARLTEAFERGTSRSDSVRHRVVPRSEVLPSAS